MNDLEIKDLHVSVVEKDSRKEILKGLNLVVKPGEIHALMGPNGSGKSTLAYAIMGHPKYEISKGSIKFKGKDVASLSPDERAKLGIFLSFQHPEAIPGVPMESFLRSAANAVRGEPYSILEFRELLEKKAEQFRIQPEFMKRYLNEGFSGGEKKKAEILQMSILQPDIAILDETDSGLDVDSLKIVAEGVNSVKREKPELSVLLITHYQRILDYIQPDFVHVML
ncbi:Fe-S cluster assembly ATPase SufC, partial [Candidatus Woesearchaeota archaeon]